MKLFLAGTPVSPSRITDVSGVNAGRRSASQRSVVEVPFAGLARTRAFAAVPSSGDVAGHVSVLRGRPAGTAARMRQQDTDLDPHRPRPCGGCG